MLYEMNNYTQFISLHNAGTPDDIYYIFLNNSMLGNMLYSVYDIVNHQTIITRFLNDTQMIFAIEKHLSNLVIDTTNSMHGMHNSILANIQNSMQNSILTDMPTDHESSSSNQLADMTSSASSASIASIASSASNMINNHFSVLINKPNSFGNTPLHLATNIQVIVLLLNKGADYSTKNNEGNTILHLCNSTVLKIILNTVVRVDVNIQNYEGCTPLHFCNSAEKANLLIENGCDINIKNNDGNSAIMLEKSEDVVKVLLINNANLNIVNKYGISAYDILKRNNPSLLYIVEENANDAFNLLQNCIEECHNCSEPEWKLMYKQYETKVYCCSPEIQSYLKDYEIENLLSCMIMFN